MSKNAVVALTVVLCVIAAGIGGFFAARTGNTAAAPATVAVGAPAPQAPAAPQPESAVASPVTATPEPATAPDAVTEPRLAVGSVSTMTARRQTQAAPTSQGRVQAPPSPARTTSTAADAAPSQPNSPVAAAAVSEPATAVPAPIETQSPLFPPTSAPEMPVPQFEEVVVDADAVLGLKLDSTVNSEMARVEDPVHAHVSRDVRVGDSVAIPAGTRVIGSVAQVDPGGKMKNRARLVVRFHTLVLADGTRTPIQTDAIYREGEAPGQSAASKMGAAAAGGALLGAILGGGKGAAIGGSIGAAGGAAAVMASERNPAVLRAGSSVTVRLLRPVTVVVNR